MNEWKNERMKERKKERKTERKKERETWTVPNLWGWIFWHTGYVKRPVPFVLCVAGFHHQNMSNWPCSSNHQEGMKWWKWQVWSFALLFGRHVSQNCNIRRGVTLLLRTVGQGHPTPIYTPTHLQHSNIHKKCQKRSFSHFSTQSPWPTDQRTDRRRYKASYRVACPQLKMKERTKESKKER